LHKGRHSWAGSGLVRRSSLLNSHSINSLSTSMRVMRRRYRIAC